MIECACIACGSVLHVADHLVGKRGKCQKCGAVITVPSPRTAVSSKVSANSLAIDHKGAPAPMAESAPATVAAGAATSTADSLRRIVRLPTAVTGVQYAEIPHNARLVRWGAGIIAFWGWFTFIVGCLAVIVGVLTLVLGAIMLSERTGIERSAAAAFSWGAISFGFSSVIAGILLIALAAFFRMMSHTCEAIRDAVILHQPATATQPSLATTN